jgi:hypothetical protein
MMHKDGGRSSRFKSDVFGLADSACSPGFVVSCLDARF